MSPEQLDFLASDIQDILKRDLVQVSGLHSQSSEDDGRAKKVFAIKFLCILNTTRFFILSFLCLFSSSKTSIDFRVIFVDTFFPFGSFGCLCNQMLLLGWIFVLNFSNVIHEVEKNGQLEVISHIKDHRKFNLTPIERIKFATYLKWIKVMRSLVIYVIVFPILSFVALGAYLSTLKVQSVAFTVASICVTLINCTQIYFGCVWGHYACMMPVHSNNVLSILFTRLFEMIKDFQGAQNVINGYLRIDSETGEQKLAVKLRQWVKRAHHLGEHQSILKMSENILRQIDLHNDTIKHILDKAISCLVPEFGLAIVFFVGERGDLLRHTFSAGAVLGALVFYVSLLKSRDVYTLSRRLCSNLHGIQVRHRGRGMKSQLQILRMIQRTSDCESWYHSIGFTVGNRGSLSPKLVLSSFFQTITIALTFLNARSAWRQH